MSALRLDTSLRQDLRLEQKLVLAPQIIQSIEILQLPILELQERIEQEISENPLLEIDEAPEQEEPREPQEEPGPESEFEKIDEMADDYNDYYSMTYSGKASEDASDRKAEAIMNTPAPSMSLQDYLFGQLRMLDVGDEKLRIGEIIIYNIDDNGYLQYPLEELIPEQDREQLLPLYEEMLALVQGFDPPGVGARNLKECLLLQLQNGGNDYALERELVSNYLNAIEKNKFPHIAKQTGRTVEEIKGAVATIAALNPKPGSLFSSEEVHYIKPDVFVEEIDGEFQVSLDDSSIPPLRISKNYRQLLKSKKSSRETREFIRKKMESAQWLMDAIQQRRETLLKVATTIVNRQGEFLRKGIEFLRPLKMKQVADSVGVHVSTVSRAIAGKYMQAPRGIFSLKYFFTGGTVDAEGEATSWKTIQHRISELIDKEDKKNPLSDDAIAERLTREGCSVARRTVTKYRKAMKIGSSRQRRQY
jgi:RNA polymerase sigma-54 factor